MSGIVSVNLKKIKGANSVNRLLDENYRDEENAEKYDDGHRIIDTEKTKENVFLIERPENYDKLRKNRISEINEKREKRADEKPTDFESWETSEKRKWANQQRNKSGKLRKDVVDTLGIVIQPSAEFINSFSREEQVKFFEDAVDVLRGVPERFGNIDTAVIHFDENTPHAQILASTLNFETLTSDAKKIVGNKSRMSFAQTVLANGLKEKGWDVERGLKRVDNPDYQNWADERRAQGLLVNRYTDRLMLETEKKLDQAKKAQTKQKSKSFVCALKLMDTFPDELNNPLEFESIEQLFVKSDNGEQINTQEFSFSKFLTESFDKVKEYIKNQLEKLKNKEVELKQREEKIEKRENNFRSELKKILSEEKIQVREDEPVLLYDGTDVVQLGTVAEVVADWQNEQIKGTGAYLNWIETYEKHFEEKYELDEYDEAAENDPLLETIYEEQCEKVRKAIQPFKDSFNNLEKYVQQEQTRVVLNQNAKHTNIFVAPTMADIQKHNVKLGIKQKANLDMFDFTPQQKAERFAQNYLNNFDKQQNQSRGRRL